MILEICITVALISLIYYFIQLKKLRETFKSFPGPKPVPFFGNALLFISAPSEIFKTLGKVHRDFGKNIILWGLVLDHGVTISDPRDVEIILTNGTTTVKSYEYEFMIPWLGTGLLISSGKKWFSRRKIITPTFHFKILENFIETFNKKIDIYIEKMKTQVNKGDVDVYNGVTLCALDIICETSMGCDIDAQNNPDAEYVRAVKEMSLLIFKRSFSLIKQWKWMFEITPLAGQQKKLIKILHKFTNDIIDEKIRKISEKKNTHDKKKIANDNDKFYGKKEKLTFLELLLQASVDGKPLSREDIREEVDTFMFEGHDTTTSGMSFTLYNLAENPKIQEKVFEEIRSVFGDDVTTPVTYNLLNELKYLDLVIKESLRMHPPVPTFLRKSVEDIDLRGTILPAGVNITIPVHFMHHYPDIFPNPEKFDPDRFLPENQEKRHPFAYIPFSAGPRNCIGQKFAILEMKSFLSKVVRNFKLLPANDREGLNLQPDLVLKSSNGIKMQFEKRIY